jgi:hypothetical protein
MTTYRVSFFNDLVNCYGIATRVWQRTIEIHRARSDDRALEAAKRRFARAEKVGCWDLRARRFEVEKIEEPAPARPRRRSAPR